MYCNRICVTVCERRIAINMNVSRETFAGSKTEHIERKKKDQIKEKGYSEKITIKIIMFHVKHQ